MKSLLAIAAVLALTVTTAQAEEKTQPLPALFAPVQLVCVAPKHDGQVICHLEADVEGAYTCEFVEGCAGGYWQFLAKGQSCLGYVSCRPNPRKPAATK